MARRNEAVHFLNMNVSVINEWTVKLSMEAYLPAENGGHLRAQLGGPGPSWRVPPLKRCKTTPMKLTRLRL